MDQQIVFFFRILEALSASAELIVTSWHEMHKAVDGLIFELFPG
jgi:hypothetical protein